MYKNFSADVLGISARQSELIELALTYGFKGIDVDIAELSKRFAQQGPDYAARFIDSAHIRVGGFELPVRWQESEIDYKADLAALAQAAEAAAAVKADRCYTVIAPASDERPFNENFEFCRQRLGEIGDVLATKGIKLAVGFQAAPNHRDGKQFEFIHQAETLLTLIKTINHSHIGLLLDLWNWRVGGGGMDQLRELKPGQVVIVRLADVPDDVDLSKIADDQRLIPGTTETSDVSATLSMLAELDYDGPVSCYAHSSCFSGLTRDGVVKRAAESLSEHWKTAVLGQTTDVAVGADA